MAVRREVDDTDKASGQVAPATAQPWLAALLTAENSAALRVQVMPAVRILEVVGAVRVLSGHEPEELRDNASLLWRLVHPDDRQAYAAAVGAEDTQTAVVRWQRRHGGVIWTEQVVTPWREELEHAAGFSVIVREVTRRLEAQRELAHTREALEWARRDSAYFHTLIHTVNDGILVNDADGTIEFVNAQLAGLLRATPDEMVGRHIFDYMDDESAATARANLRRRSVGEEDQFDFRWRRKDGSEFWSIVAAKPLYDAEGRHRGSLVAVTDITRRKQAEDALVRARNELEQRVAERTEALALEVQERRRAEADAQQASRTKSLFLANMSHELRTPLNAIIGYAEMIREDLIESAQEGLTRDIDRVMFAARHLMLVIQDVLDLSRIEAGRLDIHPEAVDLRVMIEELQATLRPSVVAASNRLHTSVALPQPVLWTDPLRLQQILLNLLGNANKFTQGGDITLGAREQHGRGVGWIVFEVVDTGIGIAPDRVSALFQAFTQVDASTTRKYGGTGLGLTISRRLCEMLGGMIEVTSEPGAGSTFTVRLPLRSPPTQESQWP